MNHSIFAWGLIAASMALLIRLVFRIQSNDARPMPMLQHFPAGKEPGGAFARFDSWFVRLCYFFGGGISPVTVALGIGLSTVLVSVVGWFFTRDAMFGIIAAILWAIGLMAIMSIIRKRALDKFEAQFPAALDLFSRAIRAGESVDQAMHLLANAKVGEPARTEFRRCAGHLDMGLSLPATLNSLCDRIDITDVRIFSAAMSAHRDGGGHLAPTLERLASVIRDRVNYRQQLKAMTGASRISVFIIAALGPILFGWLFVIHPEYGSKLWADSTGRMLLMYAVVSEMIGLAVVATLMKADY